MPFEVNITTAPYNATKEDEINAQSGRLRFASARSRTGFRSTRSSDEATMLVDLAQMVGECQRRGIPVEKYSLDAVP